MLALLLAVSGTITFHGVIVSNEYYATEVQQTHVALDPNQYPKLYAFYVQQSQ